MPTIPSVVSAFCDMLRTQTGVEIHLGQPGHEEVGTYVWPWNLSENTQIRSPLPRNGHPEPLDAPVLDLLVLVKPDSTIEGLTRLDETRVAIREHPILDLGGSTVRVMCNCSSRSELLQVFSAACLPMTICIPVTLLWSNSLESNL
jgi:hypothetical protein